MTDNTTSINGTVSSLALEYPVTISIQSLMKAGAHFGHQTDKWNPKMGPYIYGERSGLHIINLDQTMDHWKKARKVVVDVCAKGGSVLFVGTKRQVRDIVKMEAERCNGFFVSTRWLGGTLTNFGTIKRSIDRMNKLKELLTKAQNASGEVKLVKKEQLKISREITKLELSLGGIKDMKGIPSVIFITDVNKENLAIAEARRLHIPVVALCDTNVNPRPIDFPIPSNDDGVRTLRLFAAAIADAAIEGANIYRATYRQKGQDQSEGSSKESRAAASNESAATA
ncbi:MAG: 30S ribosomal protein S2 [bacterium]|nr:30S ribosomal protein S2 [bacterium]